ncbi:MAG: phosphopentomutase [Acetobacteraceae bacterium]|nr:phosphopentomutase [Acetobacteraceae bacterium]
MRVAVLVFDSLGIGALPDAARYGDEGSDTLGNLARRVGGLRLPNLQALGLGNLASVEGVRPLPPDAIRGAYGRMAMKSQGKDTMTGHWELMGVVADQPLRTFPQGFPPDLLSAFEKAIGRRVLGGMPASGTEIIARLGRKHMETGWPIVYTSADSVFQIAAHEEVIPVDDLYRMCEAARALLAGEWLMGRVIARPFVGRPGEFKRTQRRRDYALPAPRPTLLDRLTQAGVPVLGVGKIDDIFAGRGISHTQHTSGNREALEAAEELLGSTAGLPACLIMANLVDFDMLYGHRNDCPGYARALEEADGWLPRLLARLQPGDLLVVCADHGCDPTTPSTDHSREYVPVLITGPGREGSGPRTGVPLGLRDTAADLGATLAALFRVPPPPCGTSFLDRLGPLLG